MHINVGRLGLKHQKQSVRQQVEHFNTSLNWDLIWDRQIEFIKFFFFKFSGTCLAVINFCANYFLLLIFNSLTIGHFM